METAQTANPGDPSFKILFQAKGKRYKYGPSHTILNNSCDYPMRSGSPPPSPSARSPARPGLSRAVLRARHPVVGPPLHLTRRLRHRGRHVERAGLLGLAAEIFAGLAPHIGLADVRSLPIIDRLARCRRSAATSGPGRCSHRRRRRRSQHLQMKVSSMEPVGNAAVFFVCGSAVALLAWPSLAQARSRRSSFMRLRLPQYRRQRRLLL
jgi:hypothetical protein